ncbi:hypothetical protein Tco_0638420 [Tanacetum coccineum]
MADHSQKWHNRTSIKARSTDTPDGLATIQAQLNNLGREIKKVNERVYVAYVGCESCGGPHYTKDCPLKEEGKHLRKHTTLNLGCHSHKEEDIEQLLRDSTKEIRHDENSNLIKEIRAATDAAIRNQGASIKALEIQIGQMGKVLQERGSGSLPSSTETNPRDHVKSISTTVETKTPLICRRLIDDCCKEKEALKSLLMDKPRMGYQIKASMNVLKNLSQNT